MRVAIAALLLVAVGAAFDTAKADPYRWCAIFSGDLGGVRSCYFMTLEQCQATVSGVGGNCSPNPWYTGATADTSTSRRARPRS